MPIRARLRVAAIALAGLAYVLLSYALMADPYPTPWNVVGVLAPMLSAIAVGGWRNGQRLPSTAAALALAGLCFAAVKGTAVPAQAMYLAQHTGAHLFLGFGFGSTLRAGHTPLITVLARRVHRVFPPALALYTRHVTLAWTIYFVAMAALSALLFAFAPFQTWAVFADLLTPIALGVMFCAEYMLRYRLHPEFERSSIADAIRSYRIGPPGAHEAALGARGDSAA